MGDVISLDARRRLVEEARKAREAKQLQELSEVAPHLFNETPHFPDDLPPRA